MQKGVKSFYIFHTPIYRGIIFLLCLLACKDGFAQAVLPLNNYNIHDGLPSSEVYHVMQDSKGFMWFGTDHGVCRYDGYKFKTFTTADGLADNTIFECKEDYKGRIWFRSYSGKFSYFYHDSIFSLYDNEKLKSLLGPILITSFVIDSADNLYVAARAAGFIKIDLKRKGSAKLFTLPNNINYLVNISRARMPVSGGTTGVFNLLRDSSTILSIYSMSSSDQFPTKKVDLPLKGVNTNIRTEAIKSSNGEILVSVGREFFVIRNNTIIYTHRFNSLVTQLYNEGSGKTWIISQNEAPVCYSNKAIEQLPLLDIIKDQRITSVAVDAEGGLWLTSLISGIYYLSSTQFMIRTKENGLPENKINYLNVAPDSSLWVTTSLGGIITVIRKDAMMNYPVNGISNKIPINSILFHKDNTVWVGSSSSIHVYTTADFSHSLGAKFEGSGKDMIQNDDGTVWVNCIGTVRLLKLKRDSLIRLSQILPGSIVKKIVKENDTILWIGTVNGLYQYVNNSLINLGTHYPTLKKRVDDLKLSPTGDLWIATRDTGLILKSKNQLRYFNIKNGLVSNFAHCISFDYKGNLWVGANSGLSHLILHYDREGNSIVDSIKNIISPNLKEINCITCIKNMVYVGTNNGLVSFDMNTISINKTSPPIYITGLEIDNKTFPAGTTNLNLNYDENNIVINYVGLTYRDALNTMYRYKLNGIDTGWTYTPYTNVQYPKLSPGKYSFVVGARNSDGVWSKNYASVSFIINPPFWATWWARVLIIVILVVLIYWRISVILLRERMKVETTKKLTEMQLRELREQMSPHFLFNNLSTLSHLVEKKSPSAPIFVDELSKYFRYSLQARNEEFTELKNELKQAERYLNLLGIRYEGMLKVNWNINETMEGYFISNHSLQLLLENITKHNILSVESPLLVEIRTTSYNSLVVKNNLQPKMGSEESTGLGLKNIDERYYLLFRKNIKISHTADSFYVELPLVTPEEYERTDY